MLKRKRDNLSEINDIRRPVPGGHSLFLAYYARNKDEVPFSNRPIVVVPPFVRRPVGIFPVFLRDVRLLQAQEDVGSVSYHLSGGLVQFLYVCRPVLRVTDRAYQPLVCPARLCLRRAFPVGGKNGLSCNSSGVCGKRGSITKTY